jgi:hypothetical protein
MLTYRHTALAPKIEEPSTSIAKLRPNGNAPGNKSMEKETDEQQPDKQAHAKGC